MPLFGTDGIRGVANEVLDPELTIKLGQTLQYFTEIGDTVLIGVDTRNSGSMLAYSLASGISSVGRNALFAGVIPTPAIPILMEEFSAKVGVIISASHNYAEDNGIKFFNSSGFKFSPSSEHLIEEGVHNTDQLESVSWKDIGDIDEVSDAGKAYLDVLKNRFNGGPPGLDGTQIGLDCAHGATYEVAPKFFSELGAEVTSIGVDPDGKNINKSCGSTSLGRLRDLVTERDLDVGVAFDGDGDRVLLVDEYGRTVDGDRILYITASWLQDQDRLNPPIVVSTVMSNMGLEQALGAYGINLLRTQVGDKHVAKEMETNNAIVGGEQSGHIIFSEVNTTGDGLVTALKVLRVMQETGACLSELSSQMKRYPQVLRNVATEDKEKFSRDGYLQEKIDEWESRLGDSGRILVRPSGTQDLIRVMVEADSEDKASTVADNLVDLIAEELS
ncbi:MAG: phosphoglucosamine mutase [Candidatus Bipolaricaulota bacterium]